ncbi:MAG: hypothetical protein GX417_02795 [Clostridiales bacterium]|nr:hypothetical protein [Clostridiales bacterium]
MWDLFDFNNDGKVSLEEKVIGVQLLEGTLYDNSTASSTGDYGDADDDEIDGDDEPDESGSEDEDSEI